MKKVVFLSLDERPCNYEFPYKIFNSAEFVVKRVDLSLLGFKKKPANLEEVAKWLKKECLDADGLVLSLDTLVYGGIVPSRLHHEKPEILKQRLAIIKNIKELNPNLIIYAFQLIMRCPSYNSDDEEPDYYEHHGKDIFKYGQINHLIDLGIAKEDDLAYLRSHSVPQEYLDDYKTRREINREMNIETLRYVKNKIIDFLVIPQDDSAEYGWTAIDQEYIREKINQDKLMTRVYMYSGADEVGMTLMARMFTTFSNKRPKIYIKYPSITSGQIIPSLEDRYLDTMVKYQVIVSGGIVVTSLEECDGVLFINAPADKMMSRFNPTKEGRGMTALRNMPEAIEFLEYALRVKNKAIIIGDVTYGNGSSIEVYNYLATKNMLFDIAAYGGWNTASNSIGGAVAEGIAYIVNGKTQQLMDFLMLRYLEDIGYCGYVRQKIWKEILPNYPQYNYFNVLETRGEFAELVRTELLNFVKSHMPEIEPFIEIEDVYMPWKRMYEVGINVRYKKGYSDV